MRVLGRAHHGIQSGIDKRAVDVDTELPRCEVVVVENSVFDLCGDLEERVPVDFVRELGHHLAEVTNARIDGAVDTVTDAHETELLDLGVFDMAFEITFSGTDFGEALVRKVYGAGVERTSAGGDTGHCGGNWVGQGTGSVQESCSGVGHLVIGE